MTNLQGLYGPRHGHGAHWAAKYIGLPFDPVQFNCWGLVRRVLRDERGIDVPEYGEISADDLMRAARQVNHDICTKAWRKIDAPMEFDVVLMTAKEGGHRVFGHVGIMTDATHVLHVWEATAAVNMEINHALVRERIVGFYRHAERLI
jgi:cell wall-associated NlpC family hydrolase